MQTKDKHIEFKNLSLWLKLGIIGGILYLGLAILMFLVGFIGVYL